MQKKPIGFEQITVSSTAIGCTASKINPGSGVAGANYALFRCETSDVRWRDDGVDPTASVGYLLRTNEELVYDGQLSKIKFIRATADATIDASYYRAAG